MGEWKIIIVGIISDLNEKNEVENIAKVFMFGQRIRKLSREGKTKEK